MRGILVVSYRDAGQTPQQKSMNVLCVMGDSKTTVARCESVENAGEKWAFSLEGTSPTDLCAAFKNTERDRGHRSLEVTVDGDIGPANQTTTVEDDIPGIEVDRLVPVTAKLKLAEPAA